MYLKKVNIIQIYVNMRIYVNILGMHEPIKYRLSNCVDS